MHRMGLVLIVFLSLTQWSAAGVVTGSGSGIAGNVRVFEGATQVNGFLPYGGFTGGVRVATGDINGDGLTDIITGAGPGAPGGHVKVFDGLSGAESSSFFAYDIGFVGGIFVSSGDVNNDGRDDLITGADFGAPGGHVKVFDGQTGSLVRSFFAYEGFSGGVRVASGDINNDGVADIVTGAGAGAAGGHVKVFDGSTGALLRSFFGFDGFTGGVFVSAGDVNGDRFDDIIVGADAGAPGGHVKVFDGQTSSLLQSFFAFDGFTGGVRVGAVDLDGDGLTEIFTGAGAGAPGGHIKVFDGQTGVLRESFFAYDASFSGGVYVAGAAQVVPEPTAVALLAVSLVMVVVAYVARKCS